MEDRNEQTAIHPNTTQLEPYKWKPGQSGNPLGRNGGRKPGLFKHLVALADEECPGEPATTRGEKIVRRLYEIAETGEPDVALRAINEILNRSIGRPRQTIDLNTTEIDITFLAERLVEFAKKAKGVEIPVETAEQLIARTLDLR